MLLASRLRPAALALGLLTPLAAGAQTPALQPPTPESAQALETQLRSWMGRQLGPTVDLAAFPLRIRAEGDGYRLEVPFGGSLFNDMLTLSAGAFAATFKPMEGGRWAIGSATLPPRLRADMPNAGKGAPTAADITIESQEVTGVLDPTLATVSSFNGTLRGYTMRIDGPAGPQNSRMEKLTSHSEWQPTQPGRVTVLGDTTVEKYTTVSPTPDGGAVTVTIDRMGGTTRMDNVDVEGLGAIIRAAMDLSADSRAEARGETRKNPNSVDQKLARALIERVLNVLDAIETEYTYDGVNVDAGLYVGSVRKMAIGFGLGAPDGRTAMRLRLAVEGLDSPMIPPGVWRDYLPQRVTLTPRIGGIPADALKAFLRHTIETEGNDIEMEAMGLLANGPLTLGLEEVAIDLGPLRLKGEGVLEVASPDLATGEGEVRAIGLDAMIRRANTTPDLKMAAPVLIFLKGIGRQEGQETIWKITYIDRKVMVNDTDLSDLMPSK